MSGITVNVIARNRIRITVSRRVSIGNSDLGDLATPGGTAGQYTRVAAVGGIEYRDPADVLSDIGADPAGSAATAQAAAVAAAQAYADGLATNYDAAGSAATVASDLADHETDTANPHSVTAVQAGADPAGSAATAQAAAVAAAQAYADGLATNYDPAGSAAAVATDAAAAAARITWAAVPLGHAGPATWTDYEKYWMLSADLTWPDGSAGSLEAVAHEQYGAIQHYYATHADSGETYLQRPDAGQVERIAPDYFVDASAGGGGDGSLAAPYQSLADLPAITAGQVVALKRGELFDDQGLDIENAPGAGVISYGAGERPQVDGSRVISSWTLHSGNVYTATVNNEQHTGNQWVTVWEDGEALTWAPDLATCESTPGSYHHADPDASPTTLYIHPTGSGNPTSNGSEYRAGARLNGITLGLCDGGFIVGINARRHCGSSGCIKAQGLDCFIGYCNGDWGNRHNLQLGTGTITASNATRAHWGPNGASPMIFYIGDPAGGRATARECTWTFGNDHQSELEAIAVFMHYGTSPTDYWRGATFDRIVIKKALIGLRVSDFDGEMVVTNCLFEEVDSPISNVEDRIDLYVADTQFENCATAAAISGNRSATLERIETDLTTTPRGGGSSLNGIYVNGPAALTIRDSILTYRSGAVNRHVMIASATTEFTSRSNTFGDATNAYRIADAAQAIDGDYNIFQGTGSFFNVNGAALDLAAYRTATGTEPNSQTDAGHSLATAGVAAYDSAGEAKAYADSLASDYDPAGSAAAAQAAAQAYADGLATNYDAAGSASAVAGDLASHEADTANPHSVTAAQVSADPAGSAAAAQTAAQAYADGLAANYDAAGSADAAEAAAITAAIARVISRQGGLVTNGNLHLESNYNFPDFTFDASQAYFGLGSIRTPTTATKATGQTAEYIPVNPGYNYRGHIAFFNPDAATRCYFGIVYYDADLNEIAQGYLIGFGGTGAQTTLAAPLEPGDTSIWLTDATGWDGAEDAIGLWPYTNGKGYTYPDYTYTRHYERNNFASVNTGTGEIALSSGFGVSNPDDVDGIWPAGTPVANMNDSLNTSFYPFALNETVPADGDWHAYSGVLSGAGYDVDKIPPAAAFAKLYISLNFAGAASHAYAAAIDLYQIPDPA